MRRTSAFGLTRTKNKKVVYGRSVRSFTRVQMLPRNNIIGVRLYRVLGLLKRFYGWIISLQRVCRSFFSVSIDSLIFYTFFVVQIVNVILNKKKKYSRLRAKKIIILL